MQVPISVLVRVPVAVGEGVGAVGGRCGYWYRWVRVPAWVAVLVLVWVAVLVLVVVPVGVCAGIGVGVCVGTSG